MDYIKKKIVDHGFNSNFQDNDRRVSATNVDGENVTKEIKDEMISVNLGDKVALSLSGEQGIVLGVAIYSNQATHYYIRYNTATHLQTEAWFTRDAFRKVL